MPKFLSVSDAGSTAFGLCAFLLDAAKVKTTQAEACATKNAPFPIARWHSRSRQHSAPRSRMRAHFRQAFAAEFRGQDSGRVRCRPFSRLHREPPDARLL